jgi:hypothetical protein
MGESENRSVFGSDIFLWAVVIVAIGFLTLVLKQNFIREPRTSPANGCINNMRQIDGAINEWALEKGKTNGTVVTANDITNYIKLNRYGKIPTCPSGGKYTYGKVGDTPQISCSLSTAVPPHVLP